MSYDDASLQIRDRPPLVRVLDEVLLAHGRRQIAKRSLP